MLNIPSAIKSLYQIDGVHKNIRIHFPNGEFSDITNDNLVRESLHFTESLCSQDTFRFGLAEASVLEFECVGIGNMYGMTIEASIEIDGSSLSAADKATIAAGTWDGTWDAVEETFSIPLGVFRVDSCPRDHQNMAHRKVTAYTDGVSQTDIMSPFEQWKQSVWQTLKNQLYYSYEALLDANFAWSDPTILDIGYTKSAISGWSTALSSAESINKSIPVGNKTLNVSASVTAANNIYKSFSLHPSLSSSLANIFSLEYDDFDNSTVLSWVNTSLETLGIGEYFQDVVDSLGRLIYPYLPAPSYGTGFSSGSPSFLFKKDTPAFCFEEGTDSIVLIFANKAVSVSLSFDGTTLSNTLTMSAGSPFNVCRYEKDDLLNDHSISFSPSGTQQVSNGVVTNTYYSYVDSYSFVDLFRSWLELHGRFASDSRLGTIREITLDPSSPISVTPTDYSECWWDEYDISPIGAVTITYTDAEKGEGTGDAYVGTGESRYIMSDNAFIQASSMTFDDITTLLSGDFATNAANIGFTPVDLTMQGWPWLEAGDALEITAEDGTVVETYALRVEMSGIQNLQMAITAQGGQIIGEA